MTGKLADTVMAVRNGEQIARKYQPVVSNPSSPAQVATRAKLKMLSQLSAILGKQIAIPRAGAVSSRNLFTKVNFPLATFADNTASINLNALQLTKSAVSLPDVSASRASEGVGVINVALNLPGGDLARVVYVALIKEDDDTLRYAKSVVVSEPGSNGTFAGSIETGANREVVVLAYGVRDNTDAARTVFGNLEAAASEYVAKVIATRTLTESDITVTMTKGNTVPVSQG